MKMKINKKLIIIIFLILLVIRIIYKTYTFYFKYKANDVIRENFLFIQIEKESESYISFKAKKGNEVFLIYNYINSDYYTESQTKKYNEFKEVIKSLEYKDVIYLNAKVQEITKLNNQGEFDYKKYLIGENVTQSLILQDIEKTNINKANIIEKKIKEYRKYVDFKIEQILRKRKRCFI